MTVVAFPATKDPLAFDGMGIKIDVEEQRKIFDDLFTSIQTALLFCNLDHEDAKKMVRICIDEGILDEIGSNWAENIEYMEAAVETMKTAIARLEASEDRVLGRKRICGFLLKTDMTEISPRTIFRS